MQRIITLYFLSFCLWGQNLVSPTVKTQVEPVESQLRGCVRSALLGMSGSDLGQQENTGDLEEVAAGRGHGNARTACLRGLRFSYMMDS